MKYLVKHNFNVYTPTHWVHTNFELKFGTNNEGFTVEAVDQYEARSILKKVHNLNPFYLTIEEKS